MECRGVDRKKLRANRLEHLRARVAYRLGFQSVEAWLLATSPHEQATALAVAYLDGWGEEWQEVVAAIHNAGLVQIAAQGAEIRDDQWKRPRDMERMPKRDEKPASPQDWAAFGAAMQRVIMGAK